jgi:mRNA interferase MazF
MTRRDIAPWQAWWVDFDPQVGREQAGLRPGIVAGTTFACQLPNDLVFLVPCTTTDRELPFQPRVNSFKRPTFALCEQLKSVSRQRLRRQISVSLTTEDVDAIKFVLRQLVATN